MSKLGLTEEERKEKKEANDALVKALRDYTYHLSNFSAKTDIFDRIVREGIIIKVEDDESHEEHIFSIKLLPEPENF